jgi:hypothetical protein
MPNSNRPTSINANDGATATSSAPNVNNDEYSSDALG